MGIEYNYIEITDDNYILKKGDVYARIREKHTGTFERISSSVGLTRKQFLSKRITSKVDYEGTIVKVYTPGPPKQLFKSEKPFPWGY